MLSNSPLTHKGVHSPTLPHAVCGTIPEIIEFVGLSQIWELHYMMSGVMPSSVVALAGITVLSRLCVFDYLSSVLHASFSLVWGVFRS